MDLFKYSSKADIVLILVGLIFAGGAGAMQPVFMLFFGDFFDISSESNVWFSSILVGSNVNFS